MILTALLTAACCFAPTVATHTPESVRQSLESRYQHARTLKAAFYERYSDGSGGGTSESGTVYFSRPGRMRWEYESPERKLFLVDGTNVWFYVPADHTASRAKLKESSDWRTPLALLAGKADLKRLCRKIEIVDPSSISRGGVDSALLAGDDILLSCTPRGDPVGKGARKVLFEVDPEARLVRVLIREAGNVETEFRFGNWQENINIPETKFHFDVPAGVAIVDEASLTGKSNE
jgi:outer membrane lipoprotein carrier protein